MPSTDSGPLSDTVTAIYFSANSLYFSVLLQFLAMFMSMRINSKRPCGGEQRSSNPKW